MFEISKHKLHQFGYRWLQFSDDPMYLLFEKMYRCAPKLLVTAVPSPDGHGFLLTNFSCPEFARYRGREIAYFNARHAAVYWLPGASHSGGGYVKDGIYTVAVGGYALKHPVKLRISKDEQNTKIQSAELKRQPMQMAEGGFISLKAIARELKYLGQQWFDQVLDRGGEEIGSRQMRGIIAATMALTDYPDLKGKASLLSRRLDSGAASAKRADTGAYP